MRGEVSGANLFDAMKKTNKQTKKFYSKIQREDGYCMTTDGSEKSIFLIGVSTSELPQYFRVLNICTYSDNHNILMF